HSGACDRSAGAPHDPQGRQLPAQEPQATRKKRGFGQGRRGRRAKIAVGKDEQQVERDVDDQGGKRKPGEIDLPIDGGERVNERVVDEKKRDGRSEDPERWERLIEGLT